MLAEIQTPRDAKATIAAFDVLQRVAKELDLSLQEQNQIAEGRLRAQRRGGQLIPESGIGKGVKSRTLRDFELDKDESSRWQAIAGLPESVFEGYINDTLEADDELTTAGLLKLVPRIPKPKPEPTELEPRALLRFCQDLPTATIVTLILRVAFPDAETALDTTYGNGAFWDGSAHVAVTAHDGNPERAPDGVADFTELPYDDEAFDVVLFDPPHVADAGDDSIMGRRFGTMRNGELHAAVRAGACEAFRVGRLGVVIKVADHVHAERFVRMTGWICAELGEPYDVVHQVRTGAMIDPKWEEQRHAYNNGATYLIFRREVRPHGNGRP